MNCKDYQDDLRIRAANDKAAQQTKQMLDVGPKQCNISGSEKQTASTLFLSFLFIIITGKKHSLHFDPILLLNRTLQVLIGR